MPKLVVRGLLCLFIGLCLSSRRAIKRLFLGLFVFPPPSHLKQKTLEVM